MNKLRNLLSTRSAGGRRNAGWTLCVPMLADESSIVVTCFI